MRSVTAARFILTCGLICAFLSCLSEKAETSVAARNAAPLKATPEEKPDVIKIAVRFVQFEGRMRDLVIASAFVKSQDRLAYYIGFERKKDNARWSREAIVKVYKRNGWAEWEEY